MSHKSYDTLYSIINNVIPTKNILNKVLLQCEKEPILLCKLEFPQHGEFEIVARNKIFFEARTYIVCIVMIDRLLGHVVLGMKSPCKDVGCITGFRSLRVGYFTPTQQIRLLTAINCLEFVNVTLYQLKELSNGYFIQLTCL